jgi:hypothetical protein
MPPENPAADDFAHSVFASRGERNRVPGIFVPHWACHVAKNKSQLLVISQLAYWFGTSMKKSVPRPRATLKRHGYLWVRKSYKHLGREVQLSPGQVRAALRVLVEESIVVSVEDNRPGGMRWYRLHTGTIAELVPTSTPDKV